VRISSFRHFNSILDNRFPQLGYPFVSKRTMAWQAGFALKVWWVQMGLNSRLLMHEKYGQQADVYFKAFQLQWRFIKNYQIERISRRI
jgi:hypothetical protein